MWRCSAASGPIWRVANASASSSSASGGRADISMVRAGGIDRGKYGSQRLQQLVVGRRVHQLVELLHVRDVQLEEPAVAQRVAVDPRGGVAQRPLELSSCALPR